MQTSSAQDPRKVRTATGTKIHALPVGGTQTYCGLHLRRYSVADPKSTLPLCAKCFAQPTNKE